MLDLKYLCAKFMKILLNPPALKACNIDRTAHVCSGSELSSVKLGKYSYIGNRCFLVNTEIGNYCSVADRCCIGGAAHPIDRVSSSPVFHAGKNVLKKNFAAFARKNTPKTVIENDVWLGMGCYVKAGVTIHNGAVVGMGSIVTHDILPYEIWAGNPARKIGERFNQEQAARLQETQWWDWPDDVIQEKASMFDNVERFLEENWNEETGS